ncbi:MAG TPA: DUF192 domain-containing protein [Terracidiphilus sp.]|nr:DUF192 domain-containing protein [Terracidiphilus sp.]
MGLTRQIAQGFRRFLGLRSAETAKGPLKVVNATRGTIIASRLEVAGTGRTRRKGLLGRDHLDAGEGLWIVPCESIHTFFMRFPIDLIYLDRKNRIKKLRGNLGAWRLSACFTAHSVLELAAGTIGNTDTQLGDTLQFVPALMEGDDSERKAP